MKPELSWLDDPRVFRVGRMDAHSDHSFYASQEELEQQTTALTASLDGTWDFCYSRNPGLRPEKFYEPEADCSGFTAIRVPGHIELAGFEQCKYLCCMFPWDGKAYRRPQGLCREHPQGVGSFANAEENPVGSYRRTFDLPRAMAGKRVSVVFEGVEQAMYLWLNGHFVGYAEDSFTPSEFDLTPWIQETNNVIAVEVYKNSTAAYLESQDFFRFFGIFRSVSLVARPDLHVEDLDVSPVLLEGNETGILALKARLSGVLPGSTLDLRLLDPHGTELFCAGLTAEPEVTFRSQVLEEILPWDHGTPNLYTLELRLCRPDGSLSEIVPQKIGFRRLEVIDKVIHLNGRRLKLCGVNRHEWSPRTGRAIGMEEMEADLKIMQGMNINAVRTCHYPDQKPWYRMCDEAGIYMMAETNLETQGSWQKVGGVDASWCVPGDSPLWLDAILDRAESNYETFKNHPSILFWSLGNESYADADLAVMHRYFADKQDGRLIHYEGVAENRVWEDQISDVESRMYASPAMVEEYLSNHPKKPYLLCEFMHCMGNSLGGFGRYMELFDKFPMFCGGFIWDFIDQALYQTDPVTGEEVLCYGGDFDDRPSDQEFSGDGVVFADRTEKPGAQEVRYCYGKQLS